jgi:glucose/arabinose dehydrogenase
VPTAAATTTVPTTPAPEPRPLSIATVLEGLEAPWEIVTTRDGRVFVTERDSGVVSEVVDGTTREVLRLPVSASGEGGLLGLAASPDFVTDGWLYAYFTSGSDNRIVRFRVGGDPEPILTGIPRSSIHNGGRIAFGPDGMLYAGTGDAADTSTAQDPGSLGGKVLRMTRTGGVPPDNPRPGSLVYALGFRNVQGLAWSPAGRLYVAEFGPNRDDEINLVVPGGNYGWPQVTGVANRSGLVDPIAVKQPAEASWSGLAFVPATGPWGDSLLVASLRGQRLWRFELDGTGERIVGEEALFADEFGRLRQVAPLPDGTYWVLTSNRDGRGRPTAGDDRILVLRPPR